MKIPDRLITKLSEDKENDLCSIVQTNVNKFTRWFEDRPAIFFPEYTDHGIKHITAVCQSMTSLITDESWQIITPEDCAAITLSALLHDCAMHLKEEGFQALLESEYTAKQKIAVPQLHWKDLWHAYEREVARFSTKQCEELFDSEVPPPKLELENRGSWTEQQKLLIGEFLRRHHADIAYFFALHGVPGPDGKKLELSGLNAEFAELMGFIARSHNYPLRESVDLLTKNRKNRLHTHCKVHVPYIMGLLRIADYIQIGAERASEVVFDWRSLSSPRSQQEWLNHNAIQDYDIKTYENDRETLWVHAEPGDVKTFLRLQTLLSNIQRELDATWATWGEAYGILPEYKPLGMRYRRIRSNIDDVEEFQANSDIEYIPVHAKFRTSDGELLKLLVGPLYGEEPEYGVRELIQNAVDACLERDNYLNHHTEIQIDLPKLPDNSDVLVTLEEDEKGSTWFTIKDVGIGMTSDIVEKYFLTAGASYRSSDAWKEVHEVEGQSKVLRTGRFGVGLLAAFLLGDKIEITTRHINQPENQGINFQCSLESSLIEMKRTKCNIGTKIQIKLRKSVYTKLLGHTGSFPINRFDKWDWYTAQYPKLTCCIKLHVEEKLKQIVYKGVDVYRKLPQRYYLPQTKQEPPAPWRNLQHPDFDDIYWIWGGPRLVCNNFLITDTAGVNEFRENETFIWKAPETQFYNFSLTCPTLHVFDNNGKLPINLQRTGLTETVVDFLNPILCEKVCRDFLAYLLVKMPISKRINAATLPQILVNINDNAPVEDKTRLNHPLIRELRRQFDWLIWNANGLTLAEPSMTQWEGVETIGFILKHGSRYYLHPKSVPYAGDKNADLYWTIHFTSEELTDEIDEESDTRRWLDEMFDDSAYPKNFNHIRPYDMQKLFFRSFVPFAPKQRAMLINDRFLEYCDFEGLHRRPITQNVSLYSTDSNCESWLDIQYLKTLSQTSSEPFLGFWKISPADTRSLPVSPLAQVWRDIIGQPLIPFDLETRKVKLAHAYEELAKEITCWELGGTYTNIEKELEEEDSDLLLIPQN